MRILDWSALDETERQSALARPATRDSERTKATVSAIIADVRARGDAALYDLTERFDGVRLESLSVGPAEFAAAERALPSAAHRAIETAIAIGIAYPMAPRPAV